MDVVVVGSINRDISVLTPRLPEPGETVLGFKHFFGPGGKGANQAVAAARLGSEVAMVGRVGSEDFGVILVAGLDSENVETSGISVDSDVGTGLAVITIDEEAENSIVVSPGANRKLQPEHVQEQESVVADAPVVLAQLEVPVDAVVAAAELCKGTFILNPAPASELPDELLSMTDVLIPNRTELGLLAGVDTPETVEAVDSAIRSLPVRGAVVVTLGSDGALLVSDGGQRLFPVPHVEAIDTTGAGDAFCGALAHYLAIGESIEMACEKAVTAAALSVTAPGAQSALPTADQVEQLLGG